MNSLKAHEIRDPKHLTSEKQTLEGVVTVELKPGCGLLELYGQPGRVQPSHPGGGSPKRSNAGKRYRDRVKTVVCAVLLGPWQNWALYQPQVCPLGICVFAGTYWSNRKLHVSFIIIGWLILKKNTWLEADEHVNCIDC